MDLIEDEEHDPVRARALETLASAASALAEPRPYAAAAAEFEKLARERAEPFVQKRAPEAIVRKTRTQAAPPAPRPDDDVDAVFAEVLDEARRQGIDTGYLREPMTHLQFLAVYRGAAKDDRERMQKMVDEQSAHIAALEKRIAKLESKRGKK